MLHMLATDFCSENLKFWNYFLKIHFFFYPNHCTNTRLICTHFNAFSMLNTNMALQIWILQIFEKSVKYLAYRLHSTSVWRGLNCHIFSGYFKKEFFTVQNFSQMQKWAPIFASWHSYVLYNSLSVYFSKWWFKGTSHDFIIQISLFFCTWSCFCFLIHCQLYSEPRL